MYVIEIIHIFYLEHSQKMAVIVFSLFLKNSKPAIFHFTSNYQNRYKSVTVQLTVVIIISSFQNLTRLVSEKEMTTLKIQTQSQNPEMCQRFPYDPKSCFPKQQQQQQQNKQTNKNTAIMYVSDIAATTFSASAQRFPLV